MPWRLSLPLLDLIGDPRLTETDAATFAETGLRYAAVDLSVFHGLPSVLGVVRAPALETGALGVGAGTAPTHQCGERFSLRERPERRSIGSWWDAR